MASGKAPGGIDVRAGLPGRAKKTRKKISFPCLYLTRAQLRVAHVWPSCTPKAEGKKLQPRSLGHFFRYHPLPGSSVLAGRQWGQETGPLPLGTVLGVRTWYSWPGEETMTVSVSWSWMQNGGRSRRRISLLFLQMV